MKKIFIIITLILFLGLTGIALLKHGFWGIFAPCFQSFAGAQVFADLVIALVLFLIWMWQDAKTYGRNPYPWILLTFATGSIAPLFYLLLYKTNKKNE